MIKETETAPITIVIPCYNAMEFLPNCIRSIEDHAGKLLGNSVFVHIQDGSSDDNIIEYIEGLTLRGISISSLKDNGIYHAMNAAVKKVGTPWLYFLGADDRLAPDFPKALDHLTDQSCIYYGNVIKTSSGRTYDGRFSALKLIYRNICQQAILYPRKLLIENPFPERYVIQADWASNIELMSRFRYIYIGYCIAHFNDQTGISSRQVDTKFDEDKNSLVYGYFGLPMFLACATAPIPTSVYHLITRKKSTKQK